VRKQNKTWKPSGGDWPNIGPVRGVRPQERRRKPQLLAGGGIEVGIAGKKAFYLRAVGGKGRKAQDGAVKKLLTGRHESF